MQRPGTDSTEDSVSSSSSTNNGAAAAEAAAGAADGWHALQAAAAVAEAAATAIATATATPAVTTKAAAVHRVVQQPQLQFPSPPERQVQPLPQPPPPLQQPQQQRRLRRTTRWGRHRLPPSLLDLAPSDESAEDADDEADDIAEVAVELLPGEEDGGANDNENENDGVADFTFEGGQAVEEIEVDEAEVDEDLRTSEEAAPRPWPATNDDYVEFSAAVTSVGSGWNGRLLLGRRDTWRLFRQPRALSACRRNGHRSLTRRLQRQWRRLSLPQTVEQTPADDASDGQRRFSDEDVASIAEEVVRQPPDVFDRLLREAVVGQTGGGGGGCGRPTDG